MLFIQEIFSSIQGEGPHTGVPAVFIRLGKCNLACGFCDTEFNSFSSRSLDSILEETIKLSKNNEGNRIRNLIVITGGEPFLQPIECLCNELVSSGFKVQIETNGTLYRDVNPAVEIICSPKGKFDKRLSERITAYKFIVSTRRKPPPQHTAIPIYVQPMDEKDEKKNEENLAVAMELVNKYGYRLSVQLHKMIGVK